MPGTQWLCSMWIEMMSHLILYWRATHVGNNHINLVWKDTCCTLSFLPSLHSRYSLKMPWHSSQEDEASLYHWQGSEKVWKLRQRDINSFCHFSTLLYYYAAMLPFNYFAILPLCHVAILSFLSLVIYSKVQKAFSLKFPLPIFQGIHYKLSYYTPFPLHQSM